MKFSPDTARFFRVIALSAAAYGLAFAEGLASVSCIQTHLSKTVFDPGPVDGAWGKKTASALSDYAAYYDIVFSEEISKKCYRSLCGINFFKHQSGFSNCQEIRCEHTLR